MNTTENASFFWSVPGKAGSCAIQEVEICEEMGDRCCQVTNEERTYRQWRESQCWAQSQVECRHWETWLEWWGPRGRRQRRRAPWLPRVRTLLTHPLGRRRTSACVALSPACTKRRVNGLTNNIWTLLFNLQRIKWRSFVAKAVIVIKQNQFDD